MTVNSYSFRSPSPQQIQIGELIPQKESSQESIVNETTKTQPEFQQNEATQASLPSASTAPIPALSNATEDVSGALTGFSTLNSQTQAVNAYSS